MDKALQRIEEKIDTLTDAVSFMQEKMVTKDELATTKNELAGGLAQLEGRLTVRIDGIEHILENDIDKRKQLEVRVKTVETKVS